MMGSWAGNLVPQRLEVPPLTPLGQKLANLNHPEPKSGTGNSNDPGNTCDPLGTPRNLEGSGSLAGITFAGLPDRIAVLHEYQRIWRYAWMDGPLSTIYVEVSYEPGHFVMPKIVASHS
jgi:hypothetical protein